MALDILKSSPNPFKIDMDQNISFFSNPMLKTRTLLRKKKKKAQQPEPSLSDSKPKSLNLFPCAFVLQHPWG